MIKDRLLRPSLDGVSKKKEIKKDDKSEENKENLDKKLWFYELVELNLTPIWVLEK